MALAEDLVEEIRQLKAFEEIRQLMARYCLYYDTYRGSEWAALFTDDGVIEFEDGSRFTGTEEFEALAANAPPPTERIHRRFIENLIMDVDGDSATAESYVFGLDAPGADAPILIAGVGRYQDVLRRVDGRWLLAERKIFGDVTSWPVSPRIHAKSAGERHRTSAVPSAPRPGA